MAFCGTCGKITWSPVGCKCAPPREPGQLRAAVDQARDAARARAAALERFPPPPPVQLRLPDEPDRAPLRRLVEASAPCPSGDGLRYPDHYEARIAVARARRRGELAPLDVRPCSSCEGWHVVRLPR